MTNTKKDGTYNCSAISSTYKTRSSKVRHLGEIHNLLKAAWAVKDISFAMQSSLVSPDWNMCASCRKRKLIFMEHVIPGILFTVANALLMLTASISVFLLEKLSVRVVMYSKYHTKPRLWDGSPLSIYTPPNINFSRFHIQYSFDNLNWMPNILAWAKYSFLITTTF